MKDTEGLIWRQMREYSSSDARPRRVLFLVETASLALCLTLPFALRGYHGDDLQFHADSWLGMRQAWHAGNSTPGWDSLANYTLGDPRFAFYPPVSLWLGVVLSLFLPFKLVPAAFVWTSLMLGAVCMYVAGKAILGERPGTTAAFLYLISPYVLMTAITRFAVAELLVLAWLPLIILQFLQSTLDFRLRPAFLLSGLLALSWLTNIPASIALAYVLLPAAIITSARLRSLKPLLAFAAAETIAIMAAAFALVPAFFEKHWIATSALLHQDFRDYFAFHASSLPRANFIIGISVISGIQAALIIAAIVIRGKATNGQSRSLYELAALAFLFQLPVTTFLWIYAPELRYVQFPFRFLSVTGAVLPLVVLGDGMSPKFSKTAFGVVALVAALPLILYLRISPKLASALPNPAIAVQSGYPGTDEYTPAGASTRFTPADLATTLSADGCSFSVIDHRPPSTTIAVNAPTVCRLRLATYFYPYWQASDERGDRLQTSRDTDGFLVVSVPPGQHTIHVGFLMDSAVRRLSAAASVITILLLAIGLWLDSWKNRRRSTARTILSHPAPEKGEIPVSASMRVVPQPTPIPAEAILC